MGTVPGVRTPWDPIAIGGRTEATPPEEVNLSGTSTDLDHLPPFEFWPVEGPYTPSPSPPPPVGSGTYGSYELPPYPVLDRIYTPPQVIAPPAPTTPAQPSVPPGTGVATPTGHVEDPAYSGQAVEPVGTPERVLSPIGGGSDSVTYTVASPKPEPQSQVYFATVTANVAQEVVTTTTRPETVTGVSCGSPQMPPPGLLLQVAQPQQPKPPRPCEQAIKDYRAILKCQEKYMWYLNKLGADSAAPPAPYDHEWGQMAIYKYDRCVCAAMRDPAQVVHLRDTLKDLLGMSDDAVDRHLEFTDLQFCREFPEKASQGKRVTQKHRKVVGACDDVIAVARRELVSIMQEDNSYEHSVYIRKNEDGSCTWDGKVGTYYQGDGSPLVPGGMPKNARPGDIAIHTHPDTAVPSAEDVSIMLKCGLVQIVIKLTDTGYSAARFDAKHLGEDSGDNVAGEMRQLMEAGLSALLAKGYTSEEAMEILNRDFFEENAARIGRLREEKFDLRIPPC